jgi:thiol:disulfide interchange protein DsbA
MKTRYYVGAAILVSIMMSAAGLNAQQNPFPSYGSGPVEVRMYSDYLCPPCQKLEPVVEPLLGKLIKKKNIKVTFVDVPMHGASPLYARYYLYALKSSNSAEIALHVRSVFFRIAEELDAATKDQLERALAGKNIGYTVFNARPVFDLYNTLIGEDQIDTTPTCVIIRDGRKDKITGSAAIAKALEGLI